jgi:hypothetical protein
MSIAGDLIGTADKGNKVHNNTITGDETWCFLYDPQMKLQSLEWKSPSSWSKNFQVNMAKGHVMLEVFLSARALSVVSSSLKVLLNKDMYTDILHHLRDVVRRKCCKKWRNKSWFLLLKNAPAHWSVLVKDFLAKNNVTTLKHPPYSPDLAPANFYPYP